MAVSCCSAGPSRTHAAMILPVLPVGRHHRLLGVQISSAPSAAHIWSLTMQQLRVTLHLAAIKTTDVLQRARICAAIVLPKLTVIGRRVWPAADTMESLQRFIHNYVWGGAVAASAKTCRAWLRTDVAHLKVQDGGIGEPDVRATFLRLSDKVATRWASAESPVAAAVGNVLLRHAHRSAGITRLLPTPPRVLPTLAATRVAQIRRRLALPRQTDETAATHRLLRHVGRSGPRTKHWTDGWLHCDYAKRRHLLQNLLRIQRTRYGAFSVACLLAARVVGDGVLLMQTGEALQRRDFPEIVGAEDRIGDIVDVRWGGDHQVHSLCIKEAFPLRSKAAVQFRRFCEVLVFNYPALLLPHNLTNTSNHGRQLTSGGLSTGPATGSVFGWKPAQGTAKLSVSSPVRARRLGRHAPQGTPSSPSTPIPDSTRLLGFGTPQRHRLSPVATTRRVRQPNTCETANAAIGAALERLSWKRIAHLRASASSQRLLLLKVKGLRLSGWARSLEARGCPHCEPSGPSGGHTFHIMWHCSAAQLLWRILLRF
jgi:hypothetical protein